MELIKYIPIFYFKKNEKKTVWMKYKTFFKGQFGNAVNFETKCTCYL